ncbi:GH116 family glycosyl hydrolase [Nonomuraea sediminis]|uniref:GH116 family glycosyl hydrolase n=1 Tax=Nonomuraea sediminis TaxID=2835864 RepID=UPI001BDD383F|nr:GH116 family glycosyl hydrolase [Nonomuraea sediminis]
MCRNDGSCCAPAGVSRRGFLAAAAGGVAAAMVPWRAEAAAALGLREEDVILVPEDKALSAEWIRALYRRAEPTRYDSPAYVGMPVGGGCAGQLYLGGDGRLWHWDIFNTPARPTNDTTYANPPRPSSPFGHGFALRTGSRYRSLDAEGFPDHSFVGQYPIGTVTYRADDVTVTLEAFSPFIPLNADDSTIPATVLTYRIRNTGSSRLDGELLGWLENPVCLDSRTQQPILLTAAATGSGLRFGARDGQSGQPREDIPFEDFEQDTYQGWTATGTAFGTGPVEKAKVPDYMKRFGDLGGTGARFVTSHQFRNGEDVWQADAHTGRLTSRAFTVERRYVNLAVGGGGHAGQTCVNVVVDGKVVATATGHEAEPMAPRSLDVAKYEGKSASIEIVDVHTGGWGHINVDSIVFSDRPAAPRPFDQLPDAGTLALTALSPAAGVRPSIAAWDTLEAVFTSADGPAEVDAGKAAMAGAVSVPVRLAPGESRNFRFVLAWYFPIPDRQSLAFLRGSDKLRHHYAKRWGSATDVTSYVVKNLDRLEGLTRRWVDTFYTDSTLPHWFLERTFATASTLATATCYRFDDGRFYGWEGVYCCAGTCEHVWNYAQALGRLFPDLERDARERVDLGIGFHEDTGEMGFRAEAWMGWAADGQCGTILRIYREHTMSPDAGFLRRNWPRIRKSIEWVIAQDGDADGTLEGRQPNTLDTDWYGEISWMTSMYVAALKAGAIMATEAGDTAFAATCTELAAKGEAFIDATLWTGEYYIQRVDPAHADVINHNRGCHIDQMFGQSLASQYGLPRVMPADKCRTALEKLYRYNFAPDPADYRSKFHTIEGGRWFAMAREHGMLMTTWPHGGDAQAPGNPASWAAIYFNECWTGQEYQVAHHMMDEGLVEKGLTLTRAIHDRYHPAKRNPYNEIECGDHYARAMASYGVYVSACGFTYHGPEGRIGFAPRLTPDDFRAAFTAAEGWGLFRQRRTGPVLHAAIELRYGRLRVSRVTLAVPAKPKIVQVRPAGQVRFTHANGTLEITLDRPVELAAGQALEVIVR